MTAATTPKGERRRAALVAGAAKLLVEGGVDAAGHRAGRERAGLPLASTTYYFDSLEDLVTAALEHHSKAELATRRRRVEELATPHRGAGARPPPVGGARDPQPRRAGDRRPGAGHAARPGERRSGGRRRSCPP